MFTFPLSAQAPVAVPIANEPHHHPVLENDYVRVFRVTVPAHESPLLHRHDVPYLYISLGPADVINAVRGRPEARIVMTDGQIDYSPGRFAHIARNESDLDSNNVTIELPKPQGQRRNTCAQVVPNASEYHSDSPAARKGRLLDTVSQFQTDGMDASLTRVDPNVPQTAFTPTAGTLFVLLSGSAIQTEEKGKAEETLHVGDVMWLLAASHTTFSNSSRKESRYLTLGFKGSEALQKY